MGKDEICITKLTGEYALRYSKNTCFSTMTNKFLSIIFVYSLVLAILFGVFTLVDNGQLNHAVLVKDLDREMAHRINVFADGTWFMLANILGVCALGLRDRPKNS